MISNRDVNAQQLMDLWADQIDTIELQPNFERKAREFEIPTLKGVNWEEYPETVQNIITRRDFGLLKEFSKREQSREVFQILLEADEKAFLCDILEYILQELAYPPTTPQLEGFALGLTELFYLMLGILDSVPSLVIAFTACFEYTSAIEEFKLLLDENAFAFVKYLILAANSMKELVYIPLRTALEHCSSISLSAFSQLVQTVCITVQSPEIALDLLLDIIDNHTGRLLASTDIEKVHFLRSLYGTALNHLDEARENKKSAKYLLDLKFTDEADAVVAAIRRDAPLTDQPRFGDHVRLTAASLPTNVAFKYKHSMAAIVERCFDGSATFRCLQPPPTYLEECSWKLRNYGGWTTARTMFEAVEKLHVEGQGVCGVHDLLLGIPKPLSLYPTSAATPRYQKDPKLNDSQNMAVEAATNARLTALWGPPGTGKTHTIVRILLGLVNKFPEDRVLVTAPTHNAVDNLMQKFLQTIRALGRPAPAPNSTSTAAPTIHEILKSLRVSTDVGKVSLNLRPHTIDAQLGKDLSQNPKLKKQAQDRVSASRMIFTTCIGSGLGLLAKESFEIVIIDEASQQTEPSSLVPLVKGARKVVLVGDHEQLRASVGFHASTQEFGKSLFERLYTDERMAHGTDSREFRKVMLDTQYRMHSSLCEFPSKTFYQGKLKTGKLDSSALPSPLQNLFIDDTSASIHTHKLFIQCSEKEDPFQKSKQNTAQAHLCISLCKSLLTPRSTSEPSTTIKAPSITILTPYSSQTTLLTNLVSSNTLLKTSGVSVSTIDGFQGRESDIIIFSTVRCNEHGAIGFLSDMR